MLCPVISTKVGIHVLSPVRAHGTNCVESFSLKCNNTLKFKENFPYKRQGFRTTGLMSNSLLRKTILALCSRYTGAFIIPPSNNPLPADSLGTPVPGEFPPGHHV